MAVSPPPTTEPPHQGRQGHAAIAAIISDMENYLPPANNSKPGYAGCRTSYGLLTRFHQQAEDSTSPEKEYKELQQTEHDLRRRIYSLKTKKGVPDEMALLLNELRDAIAAALADGVDTECFIRAYQDVLDEKPETQCAPKEGRKMVTEVRFKKIWEELKVANARIRKLNEENNALKLRVLKLEAKKDADGGE